MIFRLSSASRSGLSALAKRYVQYLGVADASSWPGLCAALNQRAFERFNLSLHAGTAAAAAVLLARHLAGEGTNAVHVGEYREKTPGVVFVYSGQGGQWRGMGRDLFASEAVFRATIEAVDRLVQRESQFSIVQALSGEGAPGELASIDVIQPTIFAVQVALTDLLRSRGISPAAVVGHSSGEVAAAYVAGGLSLAEATRIICRRSRLMRTIAGRGLMLFVGAPSDVARELATGFDDVSLAATNGPSASVLSGDAAQVQRLYEQLQRSGEVFSRLVKVDVASHSSQVEAIREPLLDQLANLAPRPDWNAEFYSTVSGALAPDANLSGAHWWRSLRQTVQFYPAIRDLLARGFREFVEVGPHPILAGNISESALSLSESVTVLAAQERDCSGRAWLLDVVAQLNARGVPITLNEPAPALSSAGIPSATDAETRALQPEFAAQDAQSAPPLAAELAAAPEEQRARLVGDALARAIATLARVPQSAIQSSQTLLALGLDSLKILALTKQLSSLFGVSVPISKAVSCTVSALEQLISSALTRTPGSSNEGEELPLDQLVHWPSAEERAKLAAEPVELTPLQQAYWLGQNSSGANAGAAHLYFEREARGLDLARFSHALRRMIERHSMLRSYVTSDGCWETRDRLPDFSVPVVDLRGANAEARNRILSETRKRLQTSSPSSAHCPCLEVHAFLLDDSRVRLLFAANLLVLDYTSWRILEREWQLAYEDPQHVFPPLELTFADYSRAAATLRDSAPFRRSADYWEKRIADLPSGPVLPAAREEYATPRWSSRSLRISAEAWSTLQDKARRRGVTSALLLCGIYAEVVGHWSHNDHFTLNLLSQNRLPIHPQVQDVVARFSSTLLLEVDRRGSATFGERLERLQEQFFRDFDHRYVCGVEVSRRYNQFHQSDGVANFPVVYASVLGTHGSGSVPMSWAGELVERCLRTPQVKMDNQAYEEAGSVVSSWDFVENAFAPGVVDAMIDTYERLLNALAVDDAPWNAERPISDCLGERANPPRLRESMIVPRAKPLLGGGPTRAPSGKFLHDGFMQQAERVPERTALITPTLTMSYRELDRRSDALAVQLIARGARANTLVAIVMERGWEQVVAALAILKAGAAYLPVDLSLVPPARVKEILKLGEVRVCLTQLRHSLDLGDVTVIELSYDDDDVAVHRGAFAQMRRCTANDLAYVIFTSGSTGVPKGVMIEHDAVVNTIEDINERFTVTEHDRVIALASLGFDLSVWDIFGVLGAGGAIVIPSADSRMSPERWYELAQDAGVTIWNSVPKVMEMFVEHVVGNGRKLPTALRLVMMSGDWIPVSLPDAIRAAAPRADLQLISLGGATEVSIWSIYFPIEKVDPSWPSIPYGWPLSEQGVVVLDQQMRPRETWVQGEIFISGRGLARGYFRNEEATARAFVTSPVDGQRLYRTGDLGRYLPDGSIEFLGRKDSQVKVRGYRVELGEIETRVQQHPQVKQCLVVLHSPSSSSSSTAGRNGRDAQIVAYVVLRPNEELTQEALNAYLSERLPFYMVPSFLMFLDAIPLSKNGKVDRSLLALPQAAPTRSRGSLVAARDDVETRVMAVWRRVLGGREFGVTDRFFDLGGDSIQLVRVASGLEREFAVHFPIASLFGSGLSALTVEACANRLRETRQAERATAALVPFRTEGIMPPFFAVHPVGGSVLCYGRMASLLGNEQPFYALQSIAPQDDRAFAPVSELAKAYLEEVREVQPRGPYMLGGWSLGGTIAFEMARQLRRSREQVSVLVLIDSWAPIGPATTIRTQDFLEWFCRDLCGIARVDASALLRGLRPAAGSLDRALELLREYDIVTSDVGDEAIRQMFQRYCRAAQAGATFEPGAYDGSAVLIRAQQGPSSDFIRHPALRNPLMHDYSQGWSTYVMGDLRVYDAPGDHYGVVGPEGLEITTGILAATIQAADARGSEPRATEPPRQKIA